MATSLAQQLKKLAAPQTSVFDHKKKKASLLFTASEAAGYSRETFYEIGVAGFTELSQVNKHFQKFEARLFGETSKEFQRTVQTKSVNRKLDIIIEEFLLVLSPYLQKQAALKALEWLIHRFLINELNVDSLMMCILPYYETILFIRILQLIDIRDNKSPWKWLLNSQRGGRPIPKQTVFLRWASDNWFRNFLSKYFENMIKIYKHDQNLQLASSLLISTQIGGLASAEKINENHISSVCQTLDLCISSKQMDVLCGVLLVISQLAISTNLSCDFLHEITERLTKITNPEMVEHSALSLLTIFHHQNVGELKPSMLLKMEASRVLLAQISRFSSTKPVSSLMSPFAEGLVKLILSDEEIVEKEKRKRLDNLLSLIREMPLPPLEAAKIIRSFLHGIAECRADLKAFDDPIDFVQLLKTLETGHPEGFDKACAKILKSSSSGNDEETIKFQHAMLNAYKQKWVMAVEPPQSIGKEQQNKDYNRVEDKWRQCSSPGKLEPSSVAFLAKVCASVNIPEKLKATPFWDVSEKSEFSSSLRTLLKILKIVVRHQIDRTAPKNCNILRTIFKEKLGSAKTRIYFLSMILSWNLEEEEVGIDRSLKLWALGVTEALLKSPTLEGSSSLSWVLDAKEPLIPSLITPICEGEFLCKGAFRVLEAMRNLIGGCLRPNNLSSFIDGLLQKKEEIFSHASYLPSTVASLVTAKKGLGWKMALNLSACVTEPDVPLHIKGCVLYTLSEVNDSKFLSLLLPTGNALLDKVQKLEKDESLDIASSSCLYYILLRFSTNIDFLEVPGGWEMFQRSLELPDQTLKVNGELLSPQELVVNYKLLQGLTNSSRQLEVIENLISRIVRTSKPNEAAKLSKELKKIKLEASQIISMWKKYNLLSTAKSVKEQRAKRMKLQKEPKTEQNVENWRKLELTIEVIGVMTEPSNPWLLIGPICDHLESLMKSNLSVTDTLQQQMLSVCHHLLKLSSEQLDDRVFISSCKLNVALIVQCIRTTVNPDIHRRALLILSLAARYFPEQVLHNIMAIFTFMGTSLFRRDDSYSFHVIHLTISSIVPTLIKAESSDPKILLKKLSQVTQVFVDAHPDVAEHRRLPLFTQLATTLGVSQYLWLVMVLIADAYVARGPTASDEESSEDPRRLPKNIHFAIILYSQFSVVDQLKASCKVVDFISNLPEDKEALKGIEAQQLKNLHFSTLVINIETRTSRQLRQLKHTCAGLLVHLLSSEKFVGQVYESTVAQPEAELEELKNLYKILLEKSLTYLKLVIHQEQLQKSKPSGRFWSAMQRKLMDLVDSVNSLLPPPLLIEVISGLLNSTSDMIRCRAMEILASKLQPDVKFFQTKEIMDLLPFIDPLREMSRNTEEPESNRQTALFNLQLLIRILAPHVDPESFLPVLKSTASIIKRGDPSTKVITQSALVVADAVHALKFHSFVYLDKLVPALLFIMKNSLEEEAPFNLDNLIIATAVALHRIVECMPRLLPSENLESLLMVSCQLISRQDTEGLKESRLATRLTSTLGQLVRNVELRILIPVLVKTYGDMSAESMSSLPSLLTVIESLISSVKGSQLVMFKTSLVQFFTSALDIRLSKTDNNETSVHHIEGCVISALSRFLLKLNEDDNNRIFNTVLKWAWDNMDNNPDRLVTFFRFADHHAGSLKVLFIKAKLAKYVLEYSAQTLDRNNNMLQDCTVFGSGKKAEEKTSELLIYVLETLNKIFLHDSVQFINEENFNLILTPLTNQIENTLGSEEDYRKRISDHLKPCIIRFTKAVGDDSLWKELNRQVLLRVRTDNDSKVIVAGLEIFEGLTDAMGEDYLQPLLADTIPYITEALENFDEKVEVKTKEIFNKMEAILGDSLRAYLDT